MERRDFFALAGASTLALGLAGSAAAQEGGMAMARRSSPNSAAAAARRVTKLFGGKRADREILVQARATAGSIGAGSDAGDDDPWWVICGSSIAVHVVFDPPVPSWQSAEKVFGREFAKMSLSEMLTTIAKSKFGEGAAAIKVDADGQAFVSLSVG